MNNRVIISHGNITIRKENFQIRFHEESGKDTYVSVNEIDFIIIANPLGTITLPTLSYLAENKVSLFVCDWKGVPISCTMPFYGNVRRVKSIRAQTNWSKETQLKLWNIIIKNKIIEQARHMIINKSFLEDIDLMLEWSDNVVDGDIKNCEAVAAKYYFKCIFGENFSRRQHECQVDEDDLINIAMNFLSSITIGKMCMNICGRGYLTEIGIFHKSEYNSQALGCDFVEEFRPMMENYICNVLKKKCYTAFDTKLKRELLEFYSTLMKFDGKKYEVRKVMEYRINEFLNVLNETQKIEDLSELIYEYK